VTDSKFDKNSRLLSAKDFSNLKIDSSVFKKSSIIVYFKKNNHGHLRLGLSVSKKVGNSPVRNRFKRILRESFRSSSIRNLNFDILFVVSFTRSISSNSQEIKENVLLNNVSDYFKYLSDYK
jgi:ribonuclease P protein component